MRKILLGIGVLGLVLSGSAAAYSTTNWVTDVDTCGIVTDANVACSSDVVCGTYNIGENPYCAVASTVESQMPASLTVTTTVADGTGAGFHYNCWADGGCGASHWVCERSTLCSDGYQKTICLDVAGSGNPYDCDTSGTACYGGYSDCNANLASDGSGDGCEVRDYVTTYPGVANTVYDASCGWQCDASHLNCDANDTNGCEVTKNVTAHPTLTNVHYGSTCGSLVCDSGYAVEVGGSVGTDGCMVLIGEACTADNGTTNGETGDPADGMPGTCSTTSHSSSGGDAIVAGTTDDTSDACNCQIASVIPFETAVEASFNAPSGLLRGKQESATGSLIKFVGSDDSVRFEVDNSGKLTAGFIGAADVTGGAAIDEGKVLALDAAGAPIWTALSGLTIPGDGLGDGTGLSGNLQLGAFKIVNGAADTAGISVAATTGNTTIDGTLTVSGGDVAIGNTTLRGGTGVLTLTLPNADGVDGQVLKTDGLGQLGWVDETDTLGAMVACGATQIPKWDGDSWECADDVDTDTDTLGSMVACGATQIPKWDGDSWECADDIDTDTDTDTLGAMVACGATQIPKWDGDSWECADDVDTDTDTTIDPGGCAANNLLEFNTVSGNWDCVDPSLVDLGTTLDDAYDSTPTVFGRTITIDGDAMKLAGSHLTANVFELSLAGGSSGDVINVVNEGSGASIRVNNGTQDIFVVDDTRASAQTFNLMIVTADVGGKPTNTCDVTAEGDIAYVKNGADPGYYYGCKKVAAGYAWISLELFGA